LEGLLPQRKGGEYMNIWGRNLRLSIFGESHGEAIGIVIDGLPPGFPIDMDYVNFHMARRAPGQSELTTPRKESDQVEILSGVFNGVTTGAPLCGIIRNKNIRSEDYNRDLLRPGSADLVAHIKYKGHNDYRGGGHFSGRLTAPLTFAGSIVRQILEREGICIGAHILQIGTCRDISFSLGETFSEEACESSMPIDAGLLKALISMDFPVLNKAREAEMKNAILHAAKEKDSVGGIIECASWGQPAGLGSPFFDSMESSLSSMIFSIPGTKGIEFGEGFRMAEMRGSEANDPLFYDEGKIRMGSNHSGGINGGITNGMPILFRVAFRPTASIGKEQDTIDLSTGENQKIRVTGRHDPCIVPRAVVVVESALALCLMDHMLEAGWKR
jgi:chorismate synthase